MKPVQFDYRCVETVSAVLEVLREDPDTAILAGGQSLLPLMNLRLARPSRLVDIGELVELNRVFVDQDALLVGALCTHRRLETEPTIKHHAPLVTEAASHIGHVAIRNRGTLGGSLTHADPTAELPAVMVALQATLYIEAAGRPRHECPAESFFQGLYTTALEPEEMLTWIRVPTLRSGQGWGFAEISHRSGDFALCGAVALVELDENHVVQTIRGVLFGLRDRPVIAAGLGELVGAPLATESCHAAVLRAVSTIAPSDETRYQRQLAATALNRALHQASTRSVRQ